MTIVKIRYGPTDPVTSVTKVTGSDLRFGSKYLMASNDPDEMEKAVKHNDLSAHCIMLQNVIDITAVCHALITITVEDISSFSEEGSPTLKTTLTVLRDIGVDMTAKAHREH